MDVQKLLKDVRESMRAERVYADPVERDGLTVIPAATVRGGGGGGGPGQEEGGGGFGLSARPAGAWLIEDGQVRWKPAVDPNRIVLGWQIVSALAVLVAWSLLRRRLRSG